MAVADSALLLAKVEADVDGSGQKKVVELTGDKRIPGSNYYSNLWVMVKNAEGKMLTAWKADLDGGYYCLLEKVPVNAKAEQNHTKAKQKEIKAKQQNAAAAMKDVETNQTAALSEKKEETGKEGRRNGQEESKNFGQTSRSDSPDGCQGREECGCGLPHSGFFRL